MGPANGVQSAAINLLLGSKKHLPVGESTGTAPYGAPAGLEAARPAHPAARLPCSYFLAQAGRRLCGKAAQDPVPAHS